MTTRIGSSGVSTGVSALVSAPRVTAPPGRPFTAVMSAGASAIVLGAEQAVTRLPGGPILAAAFRPVPGGVGPGAAPSQSGRSAATPALSPEGSSGTGGGTGAAGAGPEGADLETVLSEGQDQNLYWLGMQERINAESRDYSAWSNLLKARHDTVKNAIGNIR